MASRHILAVRRAEAMEKLAATKRALEERYSVQFPEAPRVRAVDQEHEFLYRLEGLAADMAFFANTVLGITPAAPAATIEEHDDNVGNADAPAAPETAGDTAVAPVGEAVSDRAMAGDAGAAQEPADTGESVAPSEDAPRPRRRRRTEAQSS